MHQMIFLPFALAFIELVLGSPIVSLAPHLVDLSASRPISRTPARHIIASSVEGVLPTASATTTILAVRSSRSSAPIAGNEVKTSCNQLWANIPSEDWLFATLCSWSTADPSWPLSHLDYALEFNDPRDLPVVNVSTYDDGLNLRDPLTMVYQGVKGNGNSDPDDAWWGGAIRNALLYSSTIVDHMSGNFKNDAGFRDWAGYHSFAYLIGSYPVREDPSYFAKEVWEMWLDKSSRSPIIVLSKATTSRCLSDANRYFSITSFDTYTSTVTLWDPTSKGDAGYFLVDANRLKVDVKWLWHLM
ncbi:hypothetical protein I302_103238 [Kwoniella bestiolae CBS 10118]|uniref:Uncharacterized protein n=1 Tax=Kwoniella bestiolae CBS 10118 TaxID=1296100 RepID=A0A1B9G7V7_9TREE|nr:hypothetical protein I302_01937 [Kwoniella bestiolae CBS 10118]OCF27102.1 hypothetical protein I302_01937 [Kwoniella bestiolae CBS 10118]